MLDIYCRYFGYHGEVQHGRNLTMALSRYQDIALHPCENVPPHDEPSPLIRELLDNASNRDHEEISLGIGNLPIVDTLHGERRILCTAIETTRIPAIKISPLMDLDEIWSPSRWQYDILVDNGLDAAKIRLVPEGVDTDLFKPLATSDDDRHKPYRFLCVGKWEVRKGMDKLLRAWQMAFKPGDDVELVLHCHNPYATAYNPQAIVDRLQLKSAPIIISPPTGEVHDMVALYNSCDAFVLPTRGEGWGLPIIEAMACARPVITTNYSAHLEYANPTNAYLIDVARMTKVIDPWFFESHLDYGEWAEPDLDHLVHLLRHVYHHREEARQKGLRARRDIESGWTWDHAAQKACRVLGA